jgi:hypothetical protein
MLVLKLGLQRRSSQIPAKGKRFGGRSKGTPNKATSEIKALAQEYGAEAIGRLAEHMRGGDPKVSVQAANELLDRGYGKPAQTLIGDPEKPLERNIAVVRRTLDPRLFLEARSRHSPRVRNFTCALRRAFIHGGPFPISFCCVTPINNPLTKKEKVMKLFKSSVRGCTPRQAMAFMHKYIHEGMNFAAEFDESIASTSELEELEHLKGERARFVEDFLLTGRQALHDLDDITRTIDLPRDGLAPEFRRQWGDTIRSFHSMFDLGEVMLSGMERLGK